jgi:dihydrofolate reductase
MKSSLQEKTTTEEQTMATITIFENVTLDGVLQAPGGTDEDTRGGFGHGGWAHGYDDEVSMQFAGEGMSGSGGMLFGRRTYDHLVGHWTTTREPNPFTEVLVNSPKYVVSRSTETALPYPNSTLLAGDAVASVRTLKEQIDDDLTVLGSGELVRALHAARLIDSYVLQIHPIVLGSGTRLFGPADRLDLTLERSIPTTTGVLIAQYRARYAA